MKTIKLFILVCLLAGASACNDIINPNVREDDFLNSPGAMQSWVNGANRSFAQAIGTFAELTEILSDNYYNNYTQSSKVFDKPEILYHDTDVTALQRCIGTLRETADYGIYTVAPADSAGTNDSHLFNLYYIKGYSYLLAGEYFTGLPVEAGGEVKKWDEQLWMAADTFKAALHYAGSSEDSAFIKTLIARAYHKAGDKDSAVYYAKEALKCSTDFIKNVEFDGNHGVINNIQTHVYSTHFQPLPRLDFLDPKYFQLTNNEQRPICIAKAEEPYLILAEADLADYSITNAQAQLKELLDLVKRRPTADVNDALEIRSRYPFTDSLVYKVAFSVEDSLRLREGLVLNRRDTVGSKPPYVSIPYVSGTSVDTAMIDSVSTSVDSLLEIVYLMRQEIFFAEGRRASDLGFRLPVCEIEAANTPSASSYIIAQIPDFIPMDKVMDAFVIDSIAPLERRITITSNMNKVIVTNKNKPEVIPFFKTPLQ